MGDERKQWAYEMGYERGKEGEDPQPMLEVYQELTGKDLPPDGASERDWVLYDALADAYEAGHQKGAEVKTYEVEMRGDCREVYIVEAENEEDAMRRWHEGDPHVSEALGVEAVCATCIDDE